MAAAMGRHPHTDLRRAAMGICRDAGLHHVQAPCPATARVTAVMVLSS